MKLTAGADNPSLGKFLTSIKVIVACLIYAAIWVALWRSSHAFWFLPAGLRFATFLYSRPSSWPIWIAGDWLGIYYVTEVQTASTSIIEHGLTNYCPTIIYAAAVGILVNKSGFSAKENRTQSVLTLVTIAMFSAAVINAVVLHLVMPLDNPMLAFKGFSALGIANYALGDISGVLFALSIWEFIKSVITTSIAEKKQIFRSTFLVIFPILLLIVFLSIAGPSVEWAVLATMFIPIVYLSIKYGWTGAVLSVVIMNIAAGLMFLISSNNELLFNSQMFLVSVGLTGLFLGAAVSQQTELVLNVREISQRVIETQEYERSRISQDLHDHVGQVLTALRARLAILRHSAIANTDGEIDKLDELAAKAYSDVHEIVSDLSPKELSLFGLKKSLESPAFSEMLRAANIKYHTSFEGAISRVSSQIQIALYRITQEALSNVANHSQASNCYLNLHVEGKGELILLQVQIRDDGVGFEVDASTRGHGLQNIKDRVQAFSGRLVLASSASGTDIRIEFAL